MAVCRLERQKNPIAAHPNNLDTSNKKDRWWGFRLRLRAFKFPGESLVWAQGKGWRHGAWGTWSWGSGAPQKLNIYMLVGLFFLLCSVWAFSPLDAAANTGAGLPCPAAVLHADDFCGMFPYTPTSALLIEPMGKVSRLHVQDPFSYSFLGLGFHNTWGTKVLTSY